MNPNLMRILIQRIPSYNQLDKQTKKILIIQELDVFKDEVVRKFGSMYMYMKNWYKRNGYINSNLYYKYIAQRNGFKNRYGYLLFNIKKRGFKNKGEYENHLAKKRGFKSSYDYQRYIAKKNGFKNYIDYLDYLYQQKGYENRADFRRQHYKTMKGGLLPSNEENLIAVSEKTANTLK